MNLACRLFLAVSPVILAGSAAAQTEETYPAGPAPELYVTDNYGLMAKIPSGLTYCRLPEGWEGSDHGTVLFLKQPSSCIPSKAYSSSTRPTPEFVPAIFLYYEYNSAEVERSSGELTPPQTSIEYARESCRKPYRKIPPGLKLLGKPAVGCRHEKSDRVEIALVALYRSGNNAVSVTLSTTRERLAKDLVTLKEVASAINVCKPSWDKSKSSLVACPNAPWW